MDSGPNDVAGKRLHVAGLTPAVLALDLSQRLGNIWNGRRRRWCRCVGWSLEATPFRVSPSE